MVQLKVVHMVAMGHAQSADIQKQVVQGQLVNIIIINGFLKDLICIAMFVVNVEVQNLVHMKRVHSKMGHVQNVETKKLQLAIIATLHLNLLDQVCTEEFAQFVEKSQVTLKRVHLKVQHVQYKEHVANAVRKVLHQQDITILHLNLLGEVGTKKLVQTAEA